MIQSTANDDSSGSNLAMSRLRDLYAYCYLSASSALEEPFGAAATLCVGEIENLLLPAGERTAW